MAYCIHCGAQLKDGANFCAQCGAAVGAAVEEAEVDFEDAEEAEAEDCDETPEKGLPSDCYATFEGRVVSIYRESGAIYRRIYLHYDVLNAQISGDRVSITCEGGWHYIYTLDGILVRSGRH